MYSLQELQSGRYICRGASKEHDKLAIHYDVFVPGKCKTVKKCKESTKHDMRYIKKSLENLQNLKKYIIKNGTRTISKVIY